MNKLIVIVLAIILVIAGFFVAARLKPAGEPIPEIEQDVRY